MSEKKMNAISDTVISRIPVEISVILGKASMTLKELQGKTKGDFIPLDSGSTDLVGIFANNKLIAKGEVVVNGSNIGVTIKELVT